MLRNIYILTVFLLLIAAFTSGCSKDDIIENEPVERMVLVYLAANNDLQIEAINSIKKMQAGANGMNGTLLVYVKTNPLNSHLIKIEQSQSEDIISDTIQSYSKENSADPNFLRRVIKDARNAQPARNYGLVLWSHATSWSPPSNRVITKSFGYDDGKEMDIIEIGQALPNDFEYIMFDACSMASMEVIYELKGKAQYILASPSEVLSTGFPYDQITPYLFKGKEGLKFVSQKFIDHYRSLPGLYASATVSLIDTRELEAVALLTKLLLDTQPPTLGFNRHKIQKLDFQSGPGIPPAYDFVSFLENNYPQHISSVLIAQIEKAVIYKDHTERFFDIPIDTFSGITIYLPTETGLLEDYYVTLSWSTASQWHSIFPFAGD